MIEKKGEIRFVGLVESSGDSATISIYPDYCPAILGIENYSHLIILYWMHLRDDKKNRKTLQVIPPRHEGAPLTGVFACRSPSRPNPIGFSVVELIKVEENNIIVSSLDALDGSPVIDIKPYSVRGDCRPNAHGPKWSLRGPPT